MSLGFADEDSPPLLDVGRRDERVDDVFVNANKSMSLAVNSMCLTEDSMGLAEGSVDRTFAAGSVPILVIINGSSDTRLKTRSKDPIHLSLNVARSLQPIFKIAWIPNFLRSGRSPALSSRLWKNISAASVSHFRNWFNSMI